MSFKRLEWLACIIYNMRLIVQIKDGATKHILSGIILRNKFSTQSEVNIYLVSYLRNQGEI